MAIIKGVIKGEGYEYNTETRQITYLEKVCWNCEGSKQIQISCPNWGKNCYGKPCEFCGSKNKHSHKIIGSETVPCHTCQATGYEMQDAFSSLDFRPLLGEIAFEIFDGRHTFNDAYIGLGNFSGVTGYTRGKYSTIEGCMERITESLRRTQAGNLFNSDGYMPRVAYIKSAQEGCSFSAFFAEPTRFGSPRG